MEEKGVRCGQPPQPAPPTQSQSFHPSPGRYPAIPSATRDPTPEPPASPAPHARPPNTAAAPHTPYQPSLPPSRLARKPLPAHRSHRSPNDDRTDGSSSPHTTAMPPSPDYPGTTR